MTASASERGRSVRSEDPGLLRGRRRQPGDDRSFPEDAEGLNPWQSALDRVTGFPPEGGQAGSQPSRCCCCLGCAKK
ncbi:uncharacterized protein [Aphelocoma coerulescens]|uniref:uncharacterized protein isoform X5 n=1 Tax=Aphelocoma coerulescens TaxID=39617 RepID=UPI0036046FA5